MTRGSDFGRASTNSLESGKIPASWTSENKGPMSCAGAYEGRTVGRPDDVRLPVREARGLLDTRGRRGHAHHEEDGRANHEEQHRVVQEVELGDPLPDRAGGQARLVGTVRELEDQAQHTEGETGEER